MFIEIVEIVYAHSTSLLTLTANVFICLSMIAEAEKGLVITEGEER